MTQVCEGGLPPFVTGTRDESGLTVTLAVPLLVDGQMTVVHFPMGLGRCLGLAATLSSHAEMLLGNRLTATRKQPDPARNRKVKAHKSLRNIE